MKLSRRAETVLRILVSLVNRASTGFVNTGELASGMRISEETILELIDHLIDMGYIAEEEGKGYRLRCDPGEITLGDIILLTEVKGKKHMPGKGLAEAQGRTAESQGGTAEAPGGTAEAPGEAAGADRFEDVETVRGKLKKLGYL